MLEKLVQAAIITFLLHLIAGINYNTKIQAQVKPPAPEMSTTIISFLWRSLP
ncbi:hypothetical protein H6G80_06185 [Nostoc sp. FACHB-87]|uniref:hypothetical protein n=1 Tax=Nostocales TaxID=1161 RepID=UPI000A7879D7|nr:MULTISPECIES: hypothetical protein [Nostocales]MBD2300429.1 hypothetical protein [Nostoc sp. FACHB-190]MBD2453664.1 hypothetical protein [Nostoc sp. FACHB-87]MBD2475381.1 hypothetical protein [Anabaena sp. FACHB-83]MBD2489830.1 hypothetical protein [Aulosira sp. FACHB-615]MBD2498485.1 hypothetical protein [Nostoc sp. FACHB-280]